MKVVGWLRRMGGADAPRVCACPECGNKMVLGRLTNASMMFCAR
jgi:hypothetical protein